MEMESGVRFLILHIGELSTNVGWRNLCTSSFDCSYAEDSHPRLPSGRGSKKVRRGVYERGRVQRIEKDNAQRNHRRSSRRGRQKQYRLQEHSFLNERKMGFYRSVDSFTQAEVFPYSFSRLNIVPACRTPPLP